MSFTKTLVPRSPSGINTIGECDIFYPLQTKIQDWYPTKPPPLPPPPQTPSSSDSEDYDEDAKQGFFLQKKKLKMKNNGPNTEIFIFLPFKHLFVFFDNKVHCQATLVQ